MAKPSVASGFEGGGTLLYVLLESIMLWSALGICRLLWNKAVNALLVWRIH